MIIFARLHRNLEPVETLGELIFGLIMVLTFTIGAKLLGPEEATDGRELLAAAIGCNLAWGIIDGFLFVLGRVFERRRVATFMQSLRSAQDADSGLAALHAELAGDLADLGDPEDRLRFYKSIMSEVHRRPPEGIRVTSEDLRGAALVCILVLATAIPAAIPFLLIGDQYLALRVSNAILIGLLFLVGFHWGRHVGSRPWISGTLIMSVGVVLVLVAIPLGG